MQKTITISQMLDSIEETVGNRPAGSALENVGLRTV
jgi:hypothetical protein